MKDTLQLKELYRPVAPELELVREQIGQMWLDALNLVRTPMPEQPSVGGKLLRPALCLLSAGAGGGANLSQYTRLATAYETLHLASLTHDDVIDRAMLRRGMSALNVLWDNHAAVLGGDYLVARALETLAGYNNCDIIAHTVTSIRLMAEGELIFFGRDHEPGTRDDCILLAERKTASLFAEACSAPAYLIDQTLRDPLFHFGLALGIAFQIVDDILDITQTTEQLGKPACGDIVEGKRTIPILRLRENLDAGGIARLDAMREGEPTEADREWVRAAAAKTGAAEAAAAEARAFADKALEHLSALPESPFRASMAGIVEFILVRVS